MHTAHVDTAPTTVIVTTAGATYEQLVHCLRDLARNTPWRVRVLVAAPEEVTLPKDLARRVRKLFVSGRDATAAIAAEVEGPQAVVVIPAGSAISSSAWLEEVSARWARQPMLTGVVRGSGAGAFFFPVSVTTLEGTQSGWTPLPGLEVAGWDSDDVYEVESPAAADITAVLIVKNEERVLGQCLTAVAPFVDEVLVYDTGSTDTTREVAAAHGARVIEGYWDADFSAARNRALDHASTEWVLIIDADEVVTGSPESLREHLLLPRLDAFRVEQLSTAHDGAAEGHSVLTTRIFRRAAACYEGALHEQVVSRRGRPPLRAHSSSPAVRLLHSGFREEVLAEKDKQRRNTDIARHAYEQAVGGSPERAELAAGYGRSLALLGDEEAALEVMAELLDTPANPATMVLAGRVVVPMLLARLADQDGSGARELERWLTVLSVAGEAPGRLLLWRARIALHHGHVVEARKLLIPVLEPLVGGLDLWGNPFDPSSAVMLLITVEAGTGDVASAASRLRDELHRAPGTVPLRSLLEALKAVGWTLGDLALHAPEAFRERALREMQLLDPQVALQWFSEHRAQQPDDLRPVVAACAVAARCDWRTALEWSLAARERGLIGVCPLTDLAEQPSRDPRERALAFALVAEGFGEAPALQRLAELLEELFEEERTETLQLLLVHVPSVLVRLSDEVVAAST